MTRLLLWDFHNTLGYVDNGWTSTLHRLIHEARPDTTLTEPDVRATLETGLPWTEWQRPHPEMSEPDAWWQGVRNVLECAPRAAGLTDAEIEELLPRFRAEYSDPAQWHLFPEVIPTLERLSAEGWTHAVLSNHVPELSDIIPALGLTPHLDRVYNSAFVVYEKPHPEIFRLAQRDYADAEAIWMIGDNPVADYAGAEGVGIPAILVRNTRPEARAACPRYAADLSEVPAWLGNEDH